ncbi:helicase c2 [Salinisphaera sp. PC39]|uniref:ATP-dependent DNA helicase n=1 Tax=Salinisphaera sp. PC39 TaxID=1304156 RepID=UPI0033410B85
MTAATGDLFGAEGPLAHELPGYAPRAVQERMAAAVAEALGGGNRLLVEAGTGTGKTLAYLAPALASGRKVIVSTATRNLQDQIYRKDVPVVRRALGRRLRVSLLKGRGNYLCRHRLDLAEAAGDRRLAGRLHAVREWAARTATGDLAEIGDVGDGNPLWPRITSTTDNCLGGQCPEYENCWVLAARRAAQAADVVIANHHLLFADLALREEGFGEVLPGADAVILDEAHKLPEIAGRFFGQALSGRQLRDLVRDGHAECAELGGDMPDLDATLRALEIAEDGFLAALERLGGGAGRAWPDLARDTGLLGAADDLDRALDEAGEAARAVAERSDVLQALAQRIADLRARLGLLREADPARVSWIERRGAGWMWHATPLDVAEPFGRALAAHPGAWIFTSATLSVDGRLDYFAGRLGLEEADTLILDSPFDYRRNSLCYLPEGMPAPRSPGYDEAVIESVLPLIRAAGGGAFLLCTSHRAVRRYAELLQHRGVGPLLVQGEHGRGELLDRFRARDDAVLIGTGSFWEGVDVRGRGLRLVIIDRLPFASPSDPVLAARTAAMRERGEDPFMSFQLPQAVIALKQGAGRLIRDDDDRGLLAICDPRLAGSGYGRVFRESLPPMPVTRDAAAAADFLRALAAA